VCSRDEHIFLFDKDLRRIMMKKVLAIVLALVMVFALVACGEQQEQTTQDTTYKVGMICIGNDQAAYDRNFYMAADAAKEQLAKEGINIEWVYTYNHPEGQDVVVDCEELGDAGCKVVFCNSYGQEPDMLKVAADYPDTIFVGMTNEGSWKDNLDNTVNAFPSIYEGRYVAGVAAGLKLNELIENGTITKDQAVLGYVGAFTFAEVVSGYTAFYLGAKSVCPSATMKVTFIGSWGNATEEANAAEMLIKQENCVVISQHSDSVTPATKAEELGAYHVGYNISMSDVAPNASIISSRIDWTNYMVYIIKAAINGTAYDQDYYRHGLKDGDVVLTSLNTKAAAANTQAKLDEVINAIKAGTTQVFDTDTFTVGGQKVTTCFALDMNGDFQADTEEAVFDGAFHESYFQSAPYFALRIDGITLLNEAY